MGMAGLALPELLRSEAAAATLSTHADNVILIQHYGAPSHIDTWGPKPDAPLGIRGEFQTIATSLPGYRVSEIMPITCGSPKRNGSRSCRTSPR